MSSTNKTNPTQETIDKCKESLCEDLKTADAMQKACATNKRSKKNVIRYKTCCLVKATETIEFYQGLHLGVCITNKKKADLIKDEVKAAIKKREELEGMIKDAVKAVKNTKTKMAEAMDEACKLGRCLEEEERCNPDLYKELKKLKVNLGNGDIPFCDPDDDNNAIKIIEDKTRECYGHVTTAFDAGVEIVGIQTFFNVGVLETVAEELITKIKDFKDDLESNVKNARDEYDKALDELSSKMEEKVELSINCCHSEAEFKSGEATREFICDENGCEDKGTDALQAICEKLNKDVEDGTDDSYNCDDEEPEQQQPPSKKQDDWKMDA